MRDQIHDCFYDVVGKLPTEDKIDTILSMLPKEIINIAESWGEYDTLFGDKVYRWIKENYHEIDV